MKPQLKVDLYVWLINESDFFLSWVSFNRNATKINQFIFYVYLRQDNISSYR